MTRSPDPTLADRVFAALSRQIEAGELAPGQRLRQDEIAAAFGASHVPVREAFRRLEAEGLVARQRSSEDERRLEITLTAAGSALRDRAIDVPHQVMAAVGMGVDEIAALRDGLGPFAGRRPDLV